MINEFLFLIHVSIIVLSSLGALFLGKEALVAFVCTASILANLFVTKQMTLFSLHITCSDVFAVGALLCLNLLQEYYGTSYVRRAIIINFFLLLFFLFMSLIHCWYIPNQFDTVHQHACLLLNPMLRLIPASFIVSIVVQVIDMYFFSFLQTLCHQKLFTLRTTLSLIASQFLDTLLFSFIGLYGTVASITHVILVSFVIKIIVIMCMSPFILVTKKIIKQNTSS